METERNPNPAGSDTAVRPRLPPPQHHTRAFHSKRAGALQTVLTPQDESDGDRHVNVTPSTTGTQGSILAGKRPIASPFPDIPVTQASADAEASATERAPDTACSAGELVTAHAPSLGYKTEEPVLYQWQGINHTTRSVLLCRTGRARQLIGNEQPSGCYPLRTDLDRLRVWSWAS